MTAEILEYSSDELLGLAMIMKTPIVIVEGYDDVPIYERLSINAPHDCLVFASENILCTKQGCEGVIENIEIIRNTSSGVPVEKYILGIIDRDARYYRNTEPQDPAILILRYYSIESHFVNLQSIKYLIPRMTRATSKLIQDNLYSKIHEEISDRLMFLYLVSLEALKNACVKEYKSEFGYKESIKAIINKKQHVALEHKRDDLLEFGRDLGLNNCWQDLLKICKGKWLLELFADELFLSIQGLPQLCGSARVTQCQFCARGEFKKCLYKNPSFFSADIMRSQMFHNTDCEELGYIRERMSQLLH